MADFRRQPEWQQQADRHSALIDPVLTVRPISRFDYTVRRPVTAIDHALVFATAKGTYDVFIPPHRPSRADAAARRYASVYEVDMGTHPVQLELQLPSDDDAFSFGVTADLTWRVSDPIAVCGEGRTRRAHAARPASCTSWRGRSAARFSIEDSPAAEAAVQQAVESGGFAAGIGLAVTCVVRLRLDDEAIAHRRRQRSLRYENEMLEPEHQFRLRMAHQQHELEVLAPAAGSHRAGVAEDRVLPVPPAKRRGRSVGAASGPAPRGHPAGHEQHQTGPTGAHQRPVGADRRGRSGGLPEGRVGEAALRAVNDLIRQHGLTSPMPPPPAEEQGALPAGSVPQQQPYGDQAPQQPYTGRPQEPYPSRPTQGRRRSSPTRVSRPARHRHRHRRRRTRGRRLMPHPRSRTAPHSSTLPRRTPRLRRGPNHRLPRRLSRTPRVQAPHDGTGHR